MSHLRKWDERLSVAMNKSEELSRRTEDRLNTVFQELKTMIINGQNHSSQPEHHRNVARTSTTTPQIPTMQANRSDPILPTPVIDRRTMVNDNNMQDQQGKLGEAPVNNTQDYQLFKRISQVEFPRFDGNNFKSWLYQALQFFRVDHTPEQLKLELASMHFSGRALEWHQFFLDERGTEGLTWEEYLQEMTIRFQRGVLAKPIIALKNLKQVSTVEEYNDEFEFLKNQCVIPKELLLDHYLGGVERGDSEWY
ncbi:Retrotransposon gag protein [Quillaja saponaria]|uniref:Retrotransposon gag protein n=1 Tax=Quillaja saponaria TaxID=32244 RepID=A0AAD7P5H7_QUISA|nr:Retrotransposon gag protein [Quillaja saponaria]